MAIKDAANQGIELSKKIAPLLAGHAPDIQAVALADLLSIYLAGHVVVDDVAETAKLREELLAKHLAAVRTLIPVNEMMLEETAAKKEMMTEEMRQQ